MSRKKYSVEQILNKLREAEVLQSKGATVIETCRQIGVTEQTFYRWRKEYGGLRVDQARRIGEMNSIFHLSASILPLNPPSTH